MDTTIRNLDARLYRALRARAARESRTVGTLLNEAMREYLSPLRRRRPQAHLFELESVPYPAGNERLSETIDAILYGSRR